MAPLAPSGSGRDRRAGGASGCYHGSTCARPFSRWDPSCSRPSGWTRNSLRLTALLERHGVELVKKSVVGDLEPEIAREMRSLWESSDLVLVCGGLGPTADDLTREAAAAALDVGLVPDAGALEQIERRFAAMGRRLSPNNRKQAEILAGAQVLDNPNGTAPGQLFERDGKALFLFPGVPFELDRMAARVPGTLAREAHRGRRARDLDDQGRHAAGVRGRPVARPGLRGVRTGVDHRPRRRGRGARSARPPRGRRRAPRAPRRDARAHPRACSARRSSARVPRRLSSRWSRGLLGGGRLDPRHGGIVHRRPGGRAHDPGPGRQRGLRRWRRRLLERAEVRSARCRPGADRTRGRGLGGGGAGDGDRGLPAAWGATSASASPASPVRAAARRRSRSAPFTWRSPGPGDAAGRAPLGAFPRQPRADPDLRRADGARDAAPASARHRPAPPLQVAP